MRYRGLRIIRSWRWNGKAAASGSGRRTDLLWSPDELNDEMASSTERQMTRAARGAREVSYSDRRNVVRRGLAVNRKVLHIFTGLGADRDLRANEVGSWRAFKVIDLELT